MVHSDVHPMEEIPREALQAAFEALVLFPVRLTQLLLPVAPVFLYSEA